MTVPRTDLALEAAEDLTAAGRFAALGSGVSKWECLQGGCPVTHIRVRDRDAAEALGRPVGQYITIDLRPALARQEGLTRRASSCLAQQLRTLLPPPDGQTQFLVVGLGNAAMTPDAVGPLAADNILITRHLIDAMPQHFSGFRPVAALRPGVSVFRGGIRGGCGTGSERAFRPGREICVFRRILFPDGSRTGEADGPVSRESGPDGRKDGVFRSDGIC